MKSKNRIIVLRHEMGLNQKELAEKVGVTQSTVSAWETGRSKPSLDQLEQLTDIFRCSIDYLLGKGELDKDRGLTPSQVFEYQEQDREDYERERDYQQYRECIGEKDAEEAAERAYEERQRSTFEALQLPIFYEAYQFNEILEDLSKEQRDCLMAVVNNFAKAVNLEKYHSNKAEK